MTSEKFDVVSKPKEKESINKQEMAGRFLKLVKELNELKEDIENNAERVRGVSSKIVELAQELKGL